MKEISEIIILTGMALINEVTKGYILGIGRIIECMEKGLLYGQMEGHTQVIMNLTKNKDLEFSNGQMGGNMKEGGGMESNMEKECIIRLRAKKEKESGKKAKGLDGLGKLKDSKLMDKFS